MLREVMLFKFSVLTSIQPKITFEIIISTPTSILAVLSNRVGILKLNSIYAQVIKIKIHYWCMDFFYSNYKSHSQIYIYIY